MGDKQDNGVTARNEQAKQIRVGRQEGLPRGGATRADCWRALAAGQAKSLARACPLREGGSLASHLGCLE